MLRYIARYIALRALYLTYNAFQLPFMWNYPVASCVAYMGFKMHSDKSKIALVALDVTFLHI